MPFYHPILQRRGSWFYERVPRPGSTEIDGLRFGNRQPKPADRGSVNVMLVLLQYGVAVNGQNNEGVTPLHLASRSGSAERMLALLGHGAALNMKDQFGWTALRYAVSANSASAVQICLEHGADTGESAPVSVGQGCETWLTVAEHIKLIRSTELLCFIRKHEDPECPGETIEGLEA